MESNLRSLVELALIALLVIFVLARFILRWFKIRGGVDKHNKYDVFTATIIDIALCSLFIGLYGSMLMDDRSSSTNKVTILMCLYTIIPYSLFVSITCGFKRMKILWMTLLNIMIEYGGLVALVWIVC